MVADFAERTRLARTPAETYLSRLWAEVLDIGVVHIDDDFFALGGDSAALLHLLTRIQQENGVSLSLDTIFEAPTVSAMARLLRSYCPDSQTGRCLVALSREGTAPPLFCVHGAGGNVTIYGPLSRVLRPGRPCYGLQAVGLTREVEPDLSIDAMVIRYLADIDGVWPTGPLIVAGFSMGGLVALEIARAVAARPATARPVVCVLLDTYLTEGAGRFSRQQALFNVAMALGLDRGTASAIGIDPAGPPPSGGGVTAGHEAAALDALADELRRRRLVPQDTGRQDVARFVNMYGFNSIALDAYEPRRYDGDAILIVTGMRDATDAEVMERTGWTGLLPKSQVLRAEGDHNSFLFERSRELVHILDGLLPH